MTMTIKRTLTSGPPYKHAVVKFNSGMGALLCNNCSIILATGFDHEDKEHFCDSYDAVTGRCIDTDKFFESREEYLESLRNAGNDQEV